jgi:hypothetical protein
MTRTKLATSLVVLALTVGSGACQNARDDGIPPSDSPPTLTDDGADDGGDDSGSGADGSDEGEGTDGEGDTGGGDDGNTDGGGDSGGDDGSGDTGTGDDAGGCLGPDPDPGLDGSPQVGQPVPHWTGTDPTGTERELCEFFGKPILMNISTMWCPSCQAVAAFMAGNDSALLSAGVGQQYIDTVWIPFRSLVNDGTIIYVTVLIEGQTGGSHPSASDAKAWADAFPSPSVHTWADEPRTLWPYLTGGVNQGVPATLAIDHEFDWLTVELTGQALIDILDDYG